MTTHPWKVCVLALVTWSPSFAAVIAAGLHWNGYVVLTLALGGFVLVFTLASMLDQVANGIVRPTSTTGGLSAPRNTAPGVPTDRNGDQE